MPFINDKEFEVLKKQISDLQNEVKKIKLIEGAPVIKGFGPKRLDLNDNLDVIELKKKINAFTEEFIIGVIKDYIGLNLLLIKQQTEPEFVPDGYVAIYADSEDGNQVKLKYSTNLGAGVVIRMVYQQEEEGV